MSLEGEEGGDDDDNSSDYDNNLTTDEAHYPRSWGVINMMIGGLGFVAFGLATVVLWAIIRSYLNQKENNNNNNNRNASSSMIFNLYLFFIILPDALVNGYGGFAVIYQGTHNGLLRPAICTIRDSLGLFYFYSNVYLNTFVAREIYIIVVGSYNRRKVDPPSLQKGLCQIGVAYAIGILIATYFTLDWNGSPFTLYNRETCDWSAGSPPEEPNPIFGFWTASLLAVTIVFPPLGFVFTVWYRIWRRRLLPLRGKTRKIALYFCRIVIVFVGFYFPAMTLSTIRTWLDTEDQRVARFWTHLVYFMMVPMQCVVTLRIAIENVDYFKSNNNGSRSTSVTGIGPAEESTPPRNRRGTWLPFIRNDNDGSHTSGLSDDDDEWTAEDVYGDRPESTTIESPPEGT